MKKVGFLFFLLVSMYQIITAQTITVTGSVKNEKGVPLGYAFVQDKQVKSAVYADSLGAFSLLANPNSILLISEKGYKDALVKIDNKTSLEIVLQHSDAGQNNDNNQANRSNATADNMVSDAFSGHTNMNSAYNSSNAVEGGEVKFNGASFPVPKEKEETHGSRFLFNDWLNGSVINAKNEEIKNPGFLFKYDKIRGILLLTHDQKSAIEIDKDQVKSFTLYDQTKDPYVFEKVPAIDDVHFMQVLAAGNKYKIYKLTTTKFIKSDETTNGLVASGNPYDEYANENTYYVLNVQSNQVQKLALKKKSIKGIFGNEGDKLNTFLTEHKADSFDDHFLKNLADYMNN